MKYTSVASAVVLGGLLAAGSSMAAQVELEPGSALVLDFDIRSAAQSGQAGNVDTRHRIMNHSQDTSVTVKLIRVCGGTKSFAGQGLCEASDKEITVTPEQVVEYNVRSFFNLSRNNCPYGYVLAYATDGSASDQAIVFDNLSGTIQTRGNTASARRMGSASAVTFQSASGEEGDPIAGATSGPGASLPFDGTGYVQVNSDYSIDFLTTNNNGNQYTELSLATLDIAAGQQNDPTLVLWRAFNEAEEEVSGSIEYVCHVRVRTDDVDGPVAGAGMQGGASLRRGNFGSTLGKINLTPFGTHAIVGWANEYRPARQGMRNLFHLQRRADRSTTFITN